MMFHVEHGVVSVEGWVYCKMWWNLFEVSKADAGGGCVLKLQGLVSHAVAVC